VLPGVHSGQSGSLSMQAPAAQIGVAPVQGVDATQLPLLLHVRGVAPRQSLSPAVHSGGTTVLHDALATSHVAGATQIEIVSHAVPVALQRSRVLASHR
jgi:hypothetical protein